MAPSHTAFLAHWLRLVDLEEGDLAAKRAEIWALPGGHLGPSGLNLYNRPECTLTAIMHDYCTIDSVPCRQKAGKAAESLNFHLAWDAVW